MSTTVTYKGSTLTTVDNQTRTLKTAGKYMEGDVILTDVSSSGGYVTQDQDGYIVLPSTGGGSGGGSKQETTGTVTGGDTNVLQISCAFEPQEIYIYGDLTGDVTLRGIVTFAIIKDRLLVITNDSSTSNTQENALRINSISGYNEENSSTEPYASYSDGVLTINTVINSSAARWTSGISYSYDLIAYGQNVSPSATQHTIYFEFTDSTDATINAWYDDSFISDAIRATEPTTYGQKTVDTASLNGVEWYHRPTIQWETLFNVNNVHVNSGDPYNDLWIPDLGSVSIAVGSIWRITIDGDAYVLTATANGVYGSPYENIIGNPLYLGGTDDGSTVPFCFEQNPWGAWTGRCAQSITGDIDHALKVERQITA